MIAKHGRARDKRAMLPALTIIDDFLSDPWAARRAALALDYAPPGTGGNYPGRDTTGALPVDAINASVSRQLGVELVGAPGTEHGHCRMTLKADRGRSGVHVDPAFYSGILYLSRPEDCLKPGAGGTAATLRGIEFYNFGAFFSRAYRENDYLWGRLHGCERMIDLVCSTLDKPFAPETCAHFKREAFHAILDEEQRTGRCALRLIDEIRAEIVARMP